MITLVTGYMRQGTTLAMKCLEAGGMDILYDEKRDEFNRKRSDERYKLNPGSLCEPLPKVMRNPGFPRTYDGMAIKLVVFELHRAAVHSYRVLFMIRDLEETRQSVEAGLGQQVSSEYIGRKCSEAYKHLENRKDVHEIITIDYRNLVEKPRETLEALRGWDLDLDNAATIPNLKDYRFRLEDLTLSA